MAIDYEVRHAMPGRVRLHVPAIRSTRGFSRGLQALLTTAPAVKHVRVNEACCAVVVDYALDSTEPLTALLALAERLNPEQIAQAAPPVSPAPRSADHSHTKGTWTRFILATLGLATSLVEGPAVLTLSLVAMTAAPIVRRATTVMQVEQRLNVDCLDSIAIVSASFRGQIVTGTFITWLVALGDAIRDYTAAKSRGFIGLLNHEHGMTFVRRNHRLIEIPVRALRRGDHIVLETGATIPADGIVLSGRAVIDQKSITGEAVPVTREPRGRVFAGTVIQDGRISIRAERVGTSTTIGQLARVVADAPAGETRIQNYAERFGDRLVAPTLAVAGVTYGLTRDFDRFLSMMIVDFGSGMRVAAPTAVLATMVNAARRGVVIKGGRSLEEMERVDTLIFDKTGTLTQGILQLGRLQSIHPRRFRVRTILTLAAAVEARLRHPIARAISAAAAQLKLRIPDRTDAHFTVGLGAEGNVEGHHVLAGNERFLNQKDIRVNGSHGLMRTLAQSGYSYLLIAIDGELAGVLPYADAIRPEAFAVVRTVQKFGIRDVIMLTGDSPSASRAVAREVGTTRFMPQVLPKEKADIVRGLQQEGRSVAMVGDGINDSGALIYANVGIAMKPTADITREAADVVLLEANLWKLITAFELSRSAMTRVRQNHQILVGLNALAYALALPARLVSPATVAMVSNGAAVAACFNGLRPMLNDRA